MLSFSRSSTGRKARPPKWWGRMLDILPKIYFTWLEPQTWTPELAKKWIEFIPSKCPFERQIWYGETLILFIPPLCPINPLSAQLYSIRLKAQTYLSSLPLDSV